MLHCAAQQALQVRFAHTCPIRQGVEQRLQIDQHRVFASRHQILEMKIDRLQRIQQRQVSPLPFIKPRQLLLGLAALGFHKLDPAVRAPIQNFQQSEGRHFAVLVDPGQQFLEMHINGERARFVYQLQTRTEAQDDD